MKKPNRRVRRHFRKYQRKKGKGKGKRLSGKAISTFATDCTTEEYEEIFMGGKGRGKGRGHRAGKRSSGKGFGRKQNPRGKDGQIMKCLGKNGECGSTTHLKRDCPHEKGRGKGKGGSSPPSPHRPGGHSVLYADSFEDLPTQQEEVRMENIYMIHAEELPMPSKAPFNGFTGGQASSSSSSGVSRERAPEGATSSSS